MTTNEQKLLDRLTRRCFLEELKVERRSDREYDLHMEGRFGKDYPYMGGVLFSAWLPLMAIRELTEWTSHRIASCTDYPDMVVDGDWSGVRDSDPETIWSVFNKFVI